MFLQARGRYSWRPVPTRTGTQEKFNPEKSCRTNRNFCGVGTCLGNMPEAILTLWDDVPSVPFWQKTAGLL